MRALACLAVAIAAGCYSPSFKVGVPCSSDGLCPPGQHCNMRLDPPTCEAGDARPIDAPPDAPPTCADNTECGMMNAPICDPNTQFCRGCRADAECGSTDVCAESAGTCHNASNALFVGPSGSGTSCSRSSPCTLATAIGQAANNQRIIVVLDGTYTTQFSIPSTYASNSLTVTGIDADPAGATVNPATGQALFVAASSKALVVEGITFSGSTSNGVDNRGTLTLAYVLVETSAAAGVVSSSMYSLTILDSIIRGNTGQGIDVSAGTFEMQRSFVQSNANGGVDIRSAAYTIENSVIAANGSISSSFGGVRIQNVDGQTPQVFQFNTIASNMASVPDDGLVCPATLVVDSSIVTDPITGCTTTFSFTSGDPQFLSATDFHIAVTSGAVDMANPDATMLYDIDYQNRPLGAARDIGADEVAP